MPPGIIRRPARYRDAGGPAVSAAGGVCCRAQIKSLAEYEKMWNEAAGDIERFWGNMAGELHWFSAVHKGAGVERAVCQMVRRRQDECLVQLPRCASGNARAEQDGDHLGRRAGRTAHADLPATSRRSLQVRQRAEATGPEAGDRVSIYMPMVPELAIAMLACARIGAIHSVIFGGFSSEAIADRNNDAQAKLVITADAGWRRGKQLPLKANVDAALAKSPSVKHCIVYKRGDVQVTMQEGRDHWWHELMDNASADCPAEPLDSEHPLYILYTSGSTGKPKGIKHTTAGYNLFVKKTFEWVFDYRDEDIFWCTADCGWVTGHSYVVYGPLSAGATVVMYEGAPNWPNEGRFWEIIEKYRVTIFYTAPTAIRSFIKWGDQWVDKHDLRAPAAARHGRRRDQSRSVDVVSPQDRPRALPDRRYLVADRDRRDHDVAAARRDSHQARKLHQAAAGNRAGDRRFIGQAGAGGSRRMAGDDQALARHAARDLGRRRRATRSSIGAKCRTCTWPATTPAATTTAITGSWGASTTCSTSPGIG